MPEIIIWTCCCNARVSEHTAWLEVSSFIFKYSNHAPAPSLGAQATGSQENCQVAENTHRTGSIVMHWKRAALELSKFVQPKTRICHQEKKNSYYIYIYIYIYVCVCLLPLKKLPLHQSKFLYICFLFLVSDFCSQYPKTFFSSPLRFRKSTFLIGTNRIIFKFWDFQGGDYEECRLLGYKHPLRTSQETHYVSATDYSQLMLCKIWGFHGGDYEECRLLGYKKPSSYLTRNTLCHRYRLRPVNSLKDLRVFRQWLWRISSSWI
jgi:hypothetical protein